MQRCYIKPENWHNDSTLEPDATEQHHLLHVLRLAAGTPVLAFDGEGREAETRLRYDDTKQTAYLEIQHMHAAQKQTGQIAWILVPAIIKGSRMDSLIEKATELGATCIMPIQTARSVVRLDTHQAANKVARWNRIAISAAKQCGTPQLPHIEPVTNLQHALQRLQEQNTPILLGSLQGSPKPIASVGRAYLTKQVPALAVLTGPEGDFTDAEYTQTAEAGCIPVSLGNLTLRAETATIYALSVLQALHQEMQTEDRRRRSEVSGRWRVEGET